MRRRLDSRAIRWSTLLLTALSIFDPAVSFGSSTAAGEPSETAFEGQPRQADVDLDDVPVDRALRLLAELYDVSLVAGQLPDTRVTTRLRGVPAEDAFDAVALASGLDIEHRGSVVLVSPGANEGEARQVVWGVAPPATSGGLEWMQALGVDARRLGHDAVLLEGSQVAVEAAANALNLALQGPSIDRVFHLGAASGESTLEAVRALLDEGTESAAYDAAGHLLTVSARAATLGRLEALLGELTRSPAQFEIEVRVVEVSRNALRRLGAQGFARLEVRGGLLPTTFPLRDLADSARYLPSPNDLATLEGLGNTSGSVNAGSVSDSGFRFGQVDARGVGFLLDALEQSGEAEIVATPKVTTLDSRWAKISMVTTLRIPTFTQNQAFATTTVSGIEEVDVGTTLEVRPRRAQGREILLNVMPEVSELEPTVEVFSQAGLTQGLPVVTRRRTETEVILEPGETLVIGGLVREREDKTLGKTPGLGDIPWIGRAFQLKGRDFTSTELLVFVTPHELPPPRERRDKVRVDDVWLPAALGSRILSVRRLIASDAPVQRVAGLQTLKQIDQELLAYGLDAARDVEPLGTDSSLEVRVAAALFLLHRRPAAALGELVRFRASRRVALSALAAPMAPHLRVALAELVARSEGGVEQLQKQLRAAVAAGDAQAGGRLLQALGAVAPERAAQWAASTAEVVPEHERLDALGGANGYERELAWQIAEGKSRESRVYALAALNRALGPEADLEGLAGSVRRQILALRSAAAPISPEPGLSWSGSPAEVSIQGVGPAASRARDALRLLAEKAPDWHHLVTFALATIEVGAAVDAVQPESRQATITDEPDSRRLAHRLVRLATLVFESRVRGFPASSGRSLARAVRAELRAAELLTGAPCSPSVASQMVQEVLATASLAEAQHDLLPGPVDSRRTDELMTELPPTALFLPAIDVTTSTHSLGRIRNASTDAP